jgi:hypothetical protein
METSAKEKENVEELFVSASAYLLDSIESGELVLPK